MMDFGLFFCQEKNWKDLVHLSKVAESYGFKSVGLIDSPYNFTGIYPMLTAIALGTEKIRVGPLVTNPVTRHPSVTANSIATVNVISSGRAFLGFGRGDSAVKMLGIRPATWKLYERAVEDIRAWTRGEPVDVEGAPAPYVMPWAKGEPAIPISLGHFGPRGARVAGRLADVATAECAELGSAEWLYGMVQEEAKKNGRGHVPFEITSATHVSDDISKARDLCRWSADMATNLVWHLMRSYPIEELPKSMVDGFEFLSEADDWWGEHDWSKHAVVTEQHKKTITDEQVDKWSVSGSVEACIDKLRALEKIGVTRFVAYLIGLPADQLEEQIRVYGEKIIPEFTPCDDVEALMAASRAS